MGKYSIYINPAYGSSWTQSWPVRMEVWSIIYITLSKSWSLARPPSAFSCSTLKLLSGLVHKLNPHPHTLSVKKIPIGDYAVFGSIQYWLHAGKIKSMGELQILWFIQITFSLNAPKLEFFINYIINWSTISLQNSTFESQSIKARIEGISAIGT